MKNEDLQNLTMVTSLVFILHAGLSSVNGRHYSQSRRKYITKGKNWTGIRNYDKSFFSSLIAIAN